LNVAAWVVFHEPVQPGGGVNAGLANAGAATPRVQPRANSPAAAVNRTLFFIVHPLDATGFLTPGSVDTRTVMRGFSSSPSNGTKPCAWLGES
jgi:hypothetical protein